MEKSNNKQSVVSASAETNTPRGAEEHQRQRRRALLAAISAAGVAGGAELPRQWARPVVDHVLLPAHAQTSPRDEGCEFLCTIEFGTKFESAFDLGTSFITLTLSGGTFATCERQPGGETASYFSGENSTGFLPSTITDPLTTYTLDRFTNSVEFTGGSECELDLSDLLTTPSPD